MNSTRFRQVLLMMMAVTSAAIFSEFALGDEAGDAQRICTMMDSMGAAVECAVNESEHTVDLTADTAAVDAMQLCTSFAGMAEMLAHTLSDDWNMRVFSTQDGDTPAAVCDLG